MKSKLKKLQNKINSLSFWRKLWIMPIKPMIILSAIAAIIAFPINLIAGFVCLGITIGLFAINGINYLIFDKVDVVFYEKIRKTNKKIDNLKNELMNYEEYKNLNDDLKENEKAFNIANKIVTSENPKQEELSLFENLAYMRAKYDETCEVQKETSEMEF